MKDKFNKAILIIGVSGSIFTFVGCGAETKSPPKLTPASTPSSTPASTPASTPSSTPASPRYSGSEAEALKNARRIRLTNGAIWLDDILFNGRRLIIWGAGVPRPQSDVYIIHHSVIATRAGMHGGVPITVTEAEYNLLSPAQRDTIQDGITPRVRVNPIAGGRYIIDDPTLAAAAGIAEGAFITTVQFNALPLATQNDIRAAVNRPLVEFQSGVMNPAYNARPIGAADQTHVDRLRDEVNRQITVLNSSVHTGFYISPDRMDGTLYVNPDGGFNGTPFHVNTFSSLLDAIETDNESEFLVNLVRLATVFDFAHSEAKRGFIDVFTMLFVTKNFPSEGIRQQYYHFILRCGHVE